MVQRAQICIVERDDIVALDIEEILNGWNDSVECAHFEFLMQAREHYDGAAAPDLVIVSNEQSENADEKQKNRDWLRDLKVISLDLDGGDNPNWHRIDKPFSSNQLLSVVKSLLHTSQ